MTNYSSEVSHYRVRTALSWAVSAFGRHAVALLISTVVFAVALVGLSLCLNELVAQVTPAPQGSPQGTDAAGRLMAYLSSARHLAMLLGSVVMLVVLGIMQSAYFGGLLDLAAGRRVTLTSFLKPRSIGHVVLASLIAGVLILIGTAFCGIGGVIVGILTMFTIIVLLDRKLSPWDAVKASIEFGRANFWRLVLALLVVYAMVIVGAFAFTVGVLVAIPVSALFMVYTYRQLTGGEVAPA
jgi:uncharacterized membrane protein